MKKNIFIPLIIATNWLFAQSPFELPKNASVGKKYAQCLVYDSVHRNTYPPTDIIPPLGWEEFLIEKHSKYERFEIEMPVFDTISIKIPVDPKTKMANLPDEYGLFEQRILIKTASTKWVNKKEHKECLSANPADCLAWELVEVPPLYKKVQQLVLKASAHQRRFDTIDTVIFKQVVEIVPMKKKTIEIPPQYEKVFRKTHPYAFYSEWREILCTGHGKSPVEGIQLALKQLGLYTDKIDGIWGANTKAAIIKFQKINHLPVGSLNFETFKALGIDDN